MWLILSTVLLMEWKKWTCILFFLLNCIAYMQCTMPSWHKHIIRLLFSDSYFQGYFSSNGVIVPNKYEGKWKRDSKHRKEIEQKRNGVKQKWTAKNMSQHFLCLSFYWYCNHNISVVHSFMNGLALVKVAVSYSFL